MIDAVEASSHTLPLRDGRMLGYLDYGPQEGQPVFYFHGYPAARLEAGFLAQPAAEAGLRLIGVDRPGMGLSSFQAGRHLLDWPEDVEALAAHLHLDRFSVVGVSGGGPYALACAYKIPNRLIACGVVSGMGPADVNTAGMMSTTRLVLFLARRLPWLLTPLMWAMGRSFRNQDQARRSLVQSAAHLVEPDRACVLDPEAGGVMAVSLVEAFRQGASGPAYEAKLLGRSWGFRLEDVVFPSLFLWHGTLDRNIPVAMGRAVAETLPHCQATFYPKEGHLSVVVNHAAEIVTTLTS